MSTKIHAQVSQAYHATVEQVFDAWTIQDSVRRWLQVALQEMGLPGDIRHVEVDARRGGRFLFSDMRSGIEARHWGTYLEFDRPTRLVFTWIVHESEEADPSKVTIELQPRTTGCEVFLDHEMDARWAEYLSRTEAGWSRMLRAIAAQVERPASRP